MNLLQAMRGRSRPAAEVERYDLESFVFNGRTVYGYASPSLAGEERVDSSYLGMAREAYRRNGVVFACMLTRMLLFSEATFKYQRIRAGRPGDLWGDSSLARLETPWTGGTTGDLLARMVVDADQAGNAFVARRAEQLKVMRPDWVTIVLGSMDDPGMTADDLDAELLGYVYQPGGPGSGRPAVPLLADEVAHFAPVPDPDASFRGMSWLSPILRETEADLAATAHKQAFFRNGAAPQVVVSFDKSVDEKSVRAFQARMDATHRGPDNAYKTLYLGGGADVTVVGKDLAQLDFRATQGAGETRIAAASGVHPVIAGLSEGLAGSSLNAGNFASARRLVADRTLRPLWRNVAGSMSVLFPAPADSRLWWDDRNIAFLREDRKDASEIQFRRAQTIRQYIEAGFTAESAVAASMNEDETLLVHTGLVSVQLQKPGGEGQAVTTGQNGAAPVAAGKGG